MDNSASGSEKKFRIFSTWLRPIKPVSGRWAKGHATIPPNRTNGARKNMSDDVLERAAMGLGPCVGDDVTVPGNSRAVRTQSVERLPTSIRR